MIKRFASLAIILILSLSEPALAVQPNGGRIEGQIVNGTTGGSSVADQNITLNIDFNGNNEVSSNTANTDAEGHFTFDALSTEPGYSYQVVLTFQGAEYTSEWLNFGEGETIKSIKVTVYDSTTSDKAITAVITHTIIYIEQDSLLVKEYFLFVNEADRTYIGATDNGNTGTLRFSLPHGATELQSTMGLMDYRVVSTDGDFIDTAPILPGSKEVAYSYKISFTSGAYTLSQAVNYPTTNYDLLVQGDDIKVTGDQLTTGEPVNIGGVQFNHLSRQNLVPGNTLIITLSGSPKATSSNVTAMLTVLALIVIACGFGIFFFMRKRKLQPVSPEGIPDQRRQRLLVELAELDDNFEAGKILKHDYRQKRAQKKARLVKLMQSSAEEKANK